MAKREYEQETLAPIQASDSLAKGAIIADVLVTIIVMGGMAYDSHSVTISVLSGVTFFLLFGALVILTLSGALPAMVINGQNQQTTRQLHRLQYTAQMEQAQRVEVVRHPQLEYTQPTEPMQLPSSPSFVPAVPPADEQLKLRCYTFVRDLFDGGGEAPPQKNPGSTYEKPWPSAVREAQIRCRGVPGRAENGVGERTQAAILQRARLPHSSQVHHGN